RDDGLPGRSLKRPVARLRASHFGEGWRKASVMLRPRLAPILFSRQVQPAYICLPRGIDKVAERWMTENEGEKE
ncbi:MAG TPA: hypothetical protein VK579_13180, partial [Terriglobales bacterium]|nr:hypothetical protein [Terriglobales bacterium]